MKTRWSKITANIRKKGTRSEATKDALHLYCTSFILPSSVAELLQWISWFRSSINYRMFSALSVSRLLICLRSSLSGLNLQESHQFLRTSLEGIDTSFRVVYSQPWSVVNVLPLVTATRCSCSIPSLLDNFSSHDFVTLQAVWYSAEFSVSLITKALCCRTNATQNKFPSCQQLSLTLVCRDFLPRSNGICTRRPLVLQLYSIIAAELSEGDSSRYWNSGGNKCTAADGGRLYEKIKYRFHSKSDSLPNPLYIIQQRGRVGRILAPPKQTLLWLCRYQERNWERNWENDRSVLFSANGNLQLRAVMSTLLGEVK